MSNADLELTFRITNQKDPDQRLVDLYAFFPTVEKALKKKGVTQQMLWKEYLEKHPDGVKHTQFGEHFNRWRKRSDTTMHIVHKAGDKMYVDYAGDRLECTDPQTGEIIKVEVFVAILGSSQLTYVEASHSQKKEDFILSCENALHYYGYADQIDHPTPLEVDHPRPVQTDHPAPVLLTTTDFSFSL